MPFPSSPRHFQFPPPSPSYLPRERRSHPNDREREYRYEPTIERYDRYGRPSEIIYNPVDFGIDPRGGELVGYRPLEPRESGRQGYSGQDLDSGFRELRVRPRSQKMEKADMRIARRCDVPFGKGMNKLYKALEKADAYFDSFMRAFDTDMGSTENYATVEIQEQLWKLKVAGKKDKGTMRPGVNDRNQNDRGYDNQGQGQGQDNDGEKPKKKFEERRKELISALRLALDVQLDEDGHTTKAIARKESANRLQLKISVASEQIEDLLGKATQERSYCASLINEIQILKGLVDPKGDANKDLFKGPDDEATDVEEEDQNRDFDN